MGTVPSPLKTPKPQNPMRTLKMCSIFIILEIDNLYERKISKQVRSNRKEWKTGTYHSTLRATKNSAR